MTHENHRPANDEEYDDDAMEAWAMAQCRDDEPS